MDLSSSKYSTRRVFHPSIESAYRSHWRSSRRKDTAVPQQLDTAADIVKSFGASRYSGDSEAASSSVCAVQKATDVDATPAVIPPRLQSRRRRGGLAAWAANGGQLEIVLRSWPLRQFAPRSLVRVLALRRIIRSRLHRRKRRHASCHGNRSTLPQSAGRSIHHRSLARVTEALARRKGCWARVGRKLMLRRLVSILRLPTILVTRERCR